jgi:ribosomal-protein-alanine N-acetyltransferase
VPTDAQSAKAPGVTPDPSDPSVPSIHTKRLELVSMSVPFMRALAARDLDGAEREIGARVPAWLPGQLEDFVQYRLGQLSVDPSIRLWLGRAMVLVDGEGVRRVVGTVGFHGAPDERGRLEVGYSVDPMYRRQGLAREAVRAMFDWAAKEHGVRSFIASISPTNQPSLRLAAGFGFAQTGSHMDELDGLELVFEADWPLRELREGDAGTSRR